MKVITMAKRFEEATSIIDSIQRTSERVHISRHQCQRLADRLNHFGRSITKWKESNSPCGVIDKQAFASLFSVLRKTERLVTECTADNWASDVLVRPGRREDFEEMHKDLSLCSTSLFLTEESGLWSSEILASDAKQDEAEILQTLHCSSTSRFRSIAQNIDGLKSTVGEIFDINHGDGESERPRQDIVFTEDASKVANEKKALKNLSTTSTSFHTVTAETLDSLAVTVTEMLDANQCGNCETLVDHEVEITHLPSYVQIRPSVFQDEKYQGSGDYGEVTKATWYLSTVVIKDFPWRGGYTNEWYREAVLMTRFRHPRVMQLMGFVPETKKAVTEYMLGGDLRKFIDERRWIQESGESPSGPFSLSVAMDIMRQVASALSYMHQGGYMHGDRALTLNVMVKESDNHSLDVKVGDIGVSQERLVQWRVDLDKPFPGNPRKELIRWTAPEVVGGHYSAMSDIYSFGVLCSEILTGKFPFEESEDAAEVRALVLAGERPALPDHVEPDLGQLIRDCWCGDGTLRPTASQIMERLERIMFPVPVVNDVVGAQSETGQEHQAVNVMEHKLSLPKYLRIPESDLKLIKELGKGSFACVYNAEWHGSPCAVKQLLAGAAISELQKEVEILMKLRHPHIVELMGFSVSPCSIVMALMTEDLPSFYKRRAPGPPFEYVTALRIIKQIASGMTYLHSLNILHRDLKGCNVLVKVNGNDDIEAKIADFGVSRYFYGRSACDYTGSGFWRSPELLRAKDERVAFEYTTKGDVYSFAMTCYEVLTGKQPFEDYLYSDDKDKMGSHKIRYSNRQVIEMLVKPAENSPIPRRPELPEGNDVNLELHHLIEDCWNEVPDVRPSFQVITERLQRMRQQ